MTMPKRRPRPVEFTRDVIDAPHVGVVTKETRDGDDDAMLHLQVRHVRLGHGQGRAADV